ncbi:MAG: hypothetical protein GY860_01035 [Desulfobacteraceae bacterium]|nr:hypothetical protein [Desulfobacteraceae bacterium]
MTQIFQNPSAGDGESCTPLYQILAHDRINIASLGFRIDALGTSGFCCHDVKPDAKSENKPDLNCSHPSQSQERSLSLVSNVSIVSVYPHHSSLDTLGFLIGLFGKKKIAFQQMASSNAMISFVIAGADQKRVLELLEKKFDLPPTHTPFQQNFNDETTAFVKQRYPETSATYVEEKIKTYGIQMVADLSMFEISLNPNEYDHFEICGNGFQTLAMAGKKFYFTFAMTPSKDLCHLFCLTDPVTSQDSRSFFSQVQQVGGMDICRPVSVDLICFHGPHFGDRYGIFNTAMACLKAGSIKVLTAGCTGASICIVLPAGQGEKAVPALAKGFETP